MSFKTFSDKAATSSANKLADKTSIESGGVNSPEAPAPEPEKAEREATTSQKP